jgi:hypothetical protein
MEVRPAAEAEKRIDEIDVIGIPLIAHSRQLSCVNPLRA